MKINLKVLKEQESKDDPLDFGEEENLRLDPDAKKPGKPAIDNVEAEKSEEENVLSQAQDFVSNFIDATLGASGGTEGAAGEEGEIPIDLNNCSDDWLSFLFGAVAGGGTGTAARVGSTAIRNIAKATLEKNVRRLADPEFMGSSRTLGKVVKFPFKHPYLSLAFAAASGLAAYNASDYADDTKSNKDIKTLSNAVKYFQEGEWAKGTEAAKGITDCFWVAYTIGLLGGVSAFGGAGGAMKATGRIIASPFRQGHEAIKFMNRMRVSPGILRTIRSSDIQKQFDEIQTSLVAFLRKGDASALVRNIPSGVDFGLFDIETLRQVVKYTKSGGVYKFDIDMNSLNGVVGLAKRNAEIATERVRKEIENIEGYKTFFNPDGKTLKPDLDSSEIESAREYIRKQKELERLVDFATNDDITRQYIEALSPMVEEVNKKYVSMLTRHGLKLAKQANFQQIKDMEEFLSVISKSKKIKKGSPSFDRVAKQIDMIFGRYADDLISNAESFLKLKKVIQRRNRFDNAKMRNLDDAMAQLTRKASPADIKAIADKFKIDSKDLDTLHQTRNTILNTLDEADGVWQLSKTNEIVYKFDGEDFTNLSAAEILVDDVKASARMKKAARIVLRALKPNASTASKVLDDAPASGTFLASFGLATATSIKAADSLLGDEEQDNSKADIEKIDKDIPRDDIIIIGDSNAVPIAQKWYGKGKAKRPYDKEAPAYTYLLDKEGNIVAPTHGAAHPMYIYNQTKKFFEQKGEEYKPKVAIIHMGYNVRNSMVEGFTNTVDFLKQKGVTDIRVIDIKVDESKFKKNSKSLAQINKMKQAIRDTPGIAVIKNNGKLSDRVHFSGTYQRILDDALNGVTIGDDVAKSRGNLLKSSVPSELGVSQAHWDTYRMHLGKRESSNNYSLQGGAGRKYDGRYQIGVPARKDASLQTKDENLIKMSRQDFRSDPEAQEKALRGYTVRNLGYLNKSGKHRKLWDRLKKSPAEKMAILAVAHLLGHNKAKKFLINNLKSVAVDGYGTRDIEYYNLIKNSYRGLPRLKPRTKKTLQKEVKQMSKKDLRQIVSEVLNENSGQGYAAYPYGSSVRDDEEPKEDYIEEWKALSMEVIRDESRNTAIEIAKILVKDLELFEDVLDLAGQNQSVGTEILTKLKQSKEKA